ncbi:ABC transporter permease [Microbacterium sp. 18062]|uniref:ABC transporter permease n=1 Tax=Microbacterium sp. 18062 TaxID=2681410 RepID=UPI00135CA56E|nr:ABC transporter permease [Microbacterium sp. 18062]
MSEHIPAAATEAADTEEKPQHTRESALGRWIAYVPPLVLIALIVFFSLASPTFGSLQSIATMGSQAGILLAAAIGLTFVVVAGGIDLSIGSVALLTGTAVALLVAGIGDQAWLAVVAALAIGAVAGLLNGAVVALARVPSFIVTLGTLSFFAGLALTLTGGQARGFISNGLLALVNQPVLPGIRGTFAIGLVVFAVSWFVMRRTRFGLHLYAMGANERASRLAGINVLRVKLVVFAVSGAGAAIAGLLSVSQLQAASPALGTSILLDAIAAIAIGGTSLAGGSGGVERTFVGVLILTVLSSGLNQLGVPDFTQNMIKGAVIVLAAAFTLAGRRGDVVK